MSIDKLRQCLYNDPDEIVRAYAEEDLCSVSRDYAWHHVLKRRTLPKRWIEEERHDLIRKFLHLYTKDIGNYTRHEFLCEVLSRSDMKPEDMSVGSHQSGIVLATKLPVTFKNKKDSSISSIELDEGHLYVCIDMPWGRSCVFLPNEMPIGVTQEWLIKIAKNMGVHV